jgi:chromosome partitioning protein
VFGRLAINSGIACMLDWFKRKSTSSAPSAQLLESEEQPPLTDERLGRMLGRLGSDSRTRSEPAAKVLNRIDPLPGTDGRAAGEPAAEALNEIDQPPSADSGTTGEPAVQALNEVDQPQSADNRAEGGFTLSHAELTISRRGHGPSAAELLAKGYSFAAGPDGKMLVFDAAGHQVDTAQPSIDSVAASEPAAEAVSEIAPRPSIDSVAASEPAAEAVSEIAPQPSIDSVAASEPAAEVVSEIAPQPSIDSVAASEPAAEALNEIAPVPRARKRTIREPAAEASNEINPPPRTDSKVGGAPGKMVVIAVSSQKGGSGKTTIAAHLAVRAGAAGHGPVVLIDTDPQGSLAEWWHARSDETPVLATVKPEELAANLAELRSYGTAIAIIDTPPALTGSIEQVIAMADLILIPVRPSPHDLRAAGGTVELARKAGKPFMFIVNSASPRASITAQAVAALSEHGRVAPVILYQRTEYAASMIDGRTVTETAGSGRSAQEIAELWQCVYAQIGMRVAA